MGRNLDIAKDTVKGTAKDIADATTSIAANVIHSEHDEPTAKTPTVMHAVKTAADKNDTSTVKSIMKSIPSYKNGTPYVPKTGLALLHEGEKVTPKEENGMDAKSAMEAITGKKKKHPKKISEIRTKKTDDGKYVHTHVHHHAHEHADETHVSNNMQEAQAHLADNEPNMSAQPPEMGAPEAAPAAAAPMPTPGM